MESLLSIEQAAAILGLSPWTIRKMISTKRIRPVRIGRRVLLEQHEIRRIVDAGRSDAVATTGASQ
jgi:excisionase family DNA binding protein